MDSIAWPVIQQKKFQIAQNMDYIKLDEDLLNGGLLNDIDKEIVLDDIIVLKTEIDNLNFEINTIVSQLDSNKLVIVNTMQAINNGIGSIEVIEHNLQTVNDIYLATIAVGKRNINPYAVTLLNIAEQCPVAGGVAVMQARALYALIDIDRTYNDEDLCLQQGVLFRRAAPTKPVDLSYRFYPNRANANVKFVYHLEENSKALLKLTNNLGETVMTMTLYSGRNEATVDITQMANGIYTAIVTNDNVLLYKTKLAIVK